MTRQGGRFLVLYDNDLPRPDWLEQVLAAFRMDRRRARVPFDEHGRTMGDDRKSVLKVLGVSELVIDSPLWREDNPVTF